MSLKEAEAHPARGASASHIPEATHAPITNH
jgi:hypothetical protein